MFREMRRKQQLLSDEACIGILRKGTSGVLALYGDDGYPYAVPLSYVYDNYRIIFHGAKEGHKADAVRNCGRASFCVTGRDLVIPEKYTSYYQSVIVTGTIRILEDWQEASEALEKLAVRYYPGDRKEHRDRVIAGARDAVCMMELSVEHMTGKQAKEI